MFVAGLMVTMLGREGRAFQSMQWMPTPRWRRINTLRTGMRPRCGWIRTIYGSGLFVSPSDKDSDSVQNLFDYDGTYVDSEMDEDDLEEIESGMPSEWMVMQQLLGINIFTVILAGLIVFFLSMNMMFGPGWLGSKIGIPGTGSIQEVSPSLPGSIDLNKPEYRL